MGIHKQTHTLADGTKRTYYYAWRGGPRLPDDPDSPEFRRAFDDAVASKSTPARGTVAWLIGEFTSPENPEWTELAPRSREDHLQSFAVITAEFGKTTLKRCQEHGSRASFINWRNSMAKTPRTADKRMASLTRLFSWAVDKEIIMRNPVARPKRLYKGTRADKIWEPHHHQAFEFVASRPLLDAKLLADRTGQRQGDLLKLKWSAYDGRRLRFTQSKTKAKVSVLCTGQLKDRLDELKRINQQRENPTLTILTNSHGLPWQSGFGASWGKASRKAGIKDRTFHDLRGSFVIRCIASKLTLEQIAQVTGHSMDDLRTLEHHYMGRNEAIADTVILTVNGDGA